MRRDIALQEPRGRLTHRVLKNRWKRARTVAEKRADEIRWLRASVEAKEAECEELTIRLGEARAAIARLRAQLTQAQESAVALAARRGA